MDHHEKSITDTLVPAAGSIVFGMRKESRCQNHDRGEDDGTWMCDNYTYKYRLEISGRMPNAAADSTFVWLSNIEEISFDQAYKAAGISSSTDDFFPPEKAVLVEMH